MVQPEWTTLNTLLYIAFAFLAAGTGVVVYFGQSVTDYNKARSGVVLPARLGMSILYSAPLLALYYSARGYASSATAAQWFVLSAVFIHFIKRVGESLFLHKYSKPVSLFTTLLIGFLYSTAAFMIGRSNQYTVPEPNPFYWFGLFFFLLGIAGNFYHHKLLADLRRESLDYFIPKGGLFEYVVCPHYLFEIFTWLGFALMTQHITVWLILLFVISYLTGQSLRALDWYSAGFADFPKHRKAILPFVL